MKNTNYWAATAIAAKIAKVDVKDVRAAYRKGGKPTGNLLNAVIVAKQIMDGSFRQEVPAVAEA